jgi:virulence-associated protein VapD
MLMLGVDMKKSSAVYSIIKTIGIAGMVGTVVVAPNSAQVFSVLSKQGRNKSSKSYADYLRRSGYFEIENTSNNEFVIRLSASGKKAYSDINFEDYITSTGSWDGKWHLLMFDIPETHRVTRQYISRNLHQIGLKSIQDSVFVYPYDLSQLADAIREEYPKIASLIISACLNDIDGEKQLRSVFADII